MGALPLCLWNGENLIGAGVFCPASSQDRIQRRPHTHRQTQTDPRSPRAQREDIVATDREITTERLAGVEGVWNMHVPTRFHF